MQLKHILCCLTKSFLSLGDLDLNASHWYRRWDWQHIGQGSPFAAVMLTKKAGLGVTGGLPLDLNLETTFSRLPALKKG